MVGTKTLLRDGEGALVERLGLAEAALSAIKPRDVVEQGAHIGVIRTERLFGDGEGALVGCLGLALLTLGVIDDCERTKCPRKLGPFLAYRSGARPSKWDGLG